MGKYQDYFVKLLNEKLAAHGSVSEFCRKGNLNRSTVENWLGGRSPSIENLERIAETLGITPDQLLCPPGREPGLREVPMPGLPELIEELKHLDQGHAAELIKIFRKIVNPKMSNLELEQGQVTNKRAKA